MPRMNNVFSVAVYLIDKSYGGSEEGGWWFTYGDRDDTYTTRYFGSRDEAAAAVDRRNKAIARTLNRGRPSISSMASCGRYVAYVHEGAPPAHFPAERPHYE